MSKKLIPLGVFRAAILYLSLAANAAATEEKTTVLEVMGVPPAPDGVLRTIEGRMYLGVRVIRADVTGLLIRHQGGAAQVRLDSLSEADLKRYGLDSTAEKCGDAGSTAAGDAEDSFAWASDAAAVPLPVVLSFQVRTLLPGAVFSPARCELASCADSVVRMTWPSHWARPHPGLAYAYFPCRQLAERDFLMASGILPTPAGVQIRRLR